MSEFYNIIGDRCELERFVEWLPNSADDEQYYVQLMARKKYLPDHPALQYDKTMLKRFTTTKERLINKIEQCEVKVGCYLGKDNIPVPQESLALYISPSPRSFRKAAFKTIAEFSRKLMNDEYINPRQEVMNILQTASTKDGYHVFDIDNTDRENLYSVMEIVGGHCNVIQTRGGYHLLVIPGNVPVDKVGKDWYPKLKKVADVTGDALSPIPGTIQGGFIPRLIYTK